MVRAQARACAVSVTAGNSRRSSTAAENSPRCSKSGADRGGLCLGDDEHAGRMGVRIEDGKLTITVFRSALANAICWRRGARTRFKVVFAGSTS